MKHNVASLTFRQVRALAMADQVVLLTDAGQAELLRQAALYQAEATELKRKLGESAKEYPDLRENATFDVLSARLEHHLPKQQTDLRLLMQKAQVYRQKSTTGIIAFNDICDLENADGGQSAYWLAGPVEAAASLTRDGVPAVSYLSPIGKAIWGAKLGDKVEVHIPTRGHSHTVHYQVTAVR